MKRIRINILLLTLCFMMSLTGSAFASTGETEIATLLSDLSIMQGYPDGQLRLQQPVTRAEFSKIAVSASPYKNQVASGMSISPFGDVSYSHWAAPYVKLAVANGLMTGYPDASFRPDQTVLLEEAVTVFLRLLGYTDEDFGYSWPYGQLGLAENIGMLKGVRAGMGAALSRSDVMMLCYSLLTSSPKGSSADYLESIQYKMAEDIVLLATSREDDSVSPGRVATTAGNYKIDDDFDHTLLGMRGDAVLKNGDALVSFIPYQQSVEEYVIYSKLDDVIVTYQSGVLGQIAVDGGTTTYLGGKTTTYSQAKAEMEMGDLLSVKRSDGGGVEYLAVRKGQVTGPVIVRNENWYQELSVSTDITVMRDGVKGNTEDIKTHDVVYYSPELNMVLAYSKKVTGIYESASPNKDQLTQITVSGVTYTVESAEAFHDLSSKGSYQYGDTVTLLLGKDGAVAGVTGKSGQAETMVGFFQSAGVKNYANQVGETYSNYYITLVGADGNAFEYAAKRDYSDSLLLNQVVRLNLSDGLATVGSIKPKSLYGTVDADGRVVGAYRFAESPEILDVVSGDGNSIGTYAKVFLQRLNGISLNSSNVLYYSTNEAGEIHQLILNDATGDGYQYGIVTKAETRTSGMNVGGSYTYDIAGKTGSVSTSGTSFQVGYGQPVMILQSGGRVQSMKALSRLSDTVTAVTGNTLYGKNKSYPLSDRVVVYKKTSYDYTVIPVSELDTSVYRISAYYDRSLERGGRIRVIVAEKK